jgi:hypothetical protein
MTDDRDDKPIDLAPLDPARSDPRWTRGVERAAALAAQRHADARRAGASLVGLLQAWGWRALAAATAAAALAWIPILAGAPAPPAEPALEERLEAWAVRQEMPNAAEVLAALEGPPERSP